MPIEYTILLKITPNSLTHPIPYSIVAPIMNRNLIELRLRRKRPIFKIEGWDFVFGKGPR